MSTEFLSVPGYYSGNTLQSRNIFASLDPAQRQYVPAQQIIDGSLSRDIGSSPTNLLRAGVLLGKITSGGKYRPSIIGLTNGAVAATDTTITVAAAVVTEIARLRTLAGGNINIKLTGPPTAAGTVRTSGSLAVSAASGTTLTITGAIGVNQVEQINFNAASTAGNLQLRVQKVDGTFATTGNAAWNATDATYLASINTALDTATGVTGGIVATAISATDPDLGIVLTYSGTGYAGLPWTRAQVAVFPTSSTAAVYTPVTTAVDGRFVTASLIQPADGSQTPVTVISEGAGICVVDSAAASQNQTLGLFLRGADLISSQIIAGASALTDLDTSTQAWIKQQINGGGASTKGLFTFDGDR